MNTTVNTLSFPGLGIGEFQVNEVAFRIFGRPIVWYGIIITCGIILAYLYVQMRAKKDEGIDADAIVDYAIFCVVSGIIGARLYYVFTSWDSYAADSFWKTLKNVVGIWNGGLAIYGGIIGGAIAAFIVSRVKKIDAMKVFDMLGPAVMLGQIVGRWGNFFNAEAHGSVTDLPWRMGITVNEVTEYYHPTFLYESLWNLAGFLIINLLYRKKRYNGQVFLMYITWYGFGRMLIEGLRTDSLYIGSFRISQLVGFLCFIIGLALLVMLAIKHRKDAPILTASRTVTEAPVTAAAVEPTVTASAPMSEMPADKPSGDGDEENCKTSSDNERNDGNGSID